MESITAHAYDWQETKDRGRMEIEAWCLNRESKPTLVRVVGFCPFLNVILPDIGDVDWEEDFVHLTSFLNRVLGEDKPCKSELLHQPRLYHYNDGRKYPVMHLAFTTDEALERCRSYLAYSAREIPGLGRVPFVIAERGISSIRKMLGEHDCAYCQWFRANATIVPPAEKVSTLAGEYYVEEKDIVPLPPTETSAWKSEPGIFAYDIEAYSDNHKAFPDRYDAAHVCIMVSCIYQIVGRRDTRQRFVITLADVGAIEGFEIISVKSEYELCTKFCELIARLDPDVLTGYNILMFDNPYLDARLSRRLMSWPKMGSRLRGQGPTLIHGTPWESSAAGPVRHETLHFAGRINLDLYPMIVREYRMASNSLDAVGKKFLGRGKHDVKVKDIFLAYEHWLQKREGADEEMRRITRYCGEDSEIVMDTFDKLNVWIGHIEMANVAGMKPSELYTRGQQARGVSLVYGACKRLGYVMDLRESNDRNRSSTKRKKGDKSDTYRGAVVFEPVVGLHDFVLCLDFKSLYPSVIIQKNICWTTFVAPGTKEANEECNEVVVSDDVEAKTRTHKWVKKEKRLGILPLIEMELIARRREVQAMAKKAGGMEWVVLDKRQLALKTTANGMYGLLGVPNGKLALVQGAESVTGRGREVATTANHYLRDKYKANVVYGDTDSVMPVCPDITDWKSAYERGVTLAKEVTALFPPPLEVEFEKFGRLLLVTAKRYVFWHASSKTHSLCPINDPNAMMVKGLLSARRDNCQWSREAYNRLIALCIQRPHIQDVLDCMLNDIVGLAEGKVSLPDLVISRKLAARYESKTAFMPVFADELRKRGKPPNAGDRLEYVIVKPIDGKKNLGYRARLVDEFLDGNGAENLDYTYYVGNIVCKPFEQLWNLTFPREVEALTAHHREQNAGLILCKLGQMGYAQVVQNARARGSNAIETLALLEKEAGIANAITKARRATVSGRHILDCRVDCHPVRVVLKAMKAGRLDEALGAMLSPAAREKVGK